MSSHRLQGSQQGYKKIHMAHAQSGGHIFQIKQSSALWTFDQDTITFP